MFQERKNYNAQKEIYQVTLVILIIIMSAILIFSMKSDYRLAKSSVDDWIISSPKPVLDSRE